MNAVLIVDDLAVARQLLEDVVHCAFPEAKRVAADSLQSGRLSAARQAFDLALIDLSLGDGSGMSLISELRQQQPQCTVIVASIIDDDEHLFLALKSGAQGYLLKDAPKERLVLQLTGIAGGEPPLSPAMARRLIQYFQRTEATGKDGQWSLSAREREVLALLAKGLRLADIALALGISRHTAGDHVKNLYRKLNISTRAEAAIQARNLGLA